MRDSRLVFGVIENHQEHFSYCRFIVDEQDFRHVILPAITVDHAAQFFKATVSPDLCQQRE